MATSPRQRIALAVALALTVALATPATSAAAHPGGPPHGLPLGASDLPETRTTVTLQRGVTLTTITRGVTDTTDRWTVEVASPDAGNPDPDAPAVAITPRAEAEQTAAALTAAGLTPRVEAVRTPATVGYGGLIGYRVRIGSTTDKASLDATISAVKAAGFAGGAVYTGWDGDADAAPSRGTWHLQLLTIDPRVFRGRLLDSYGPDFVNRETTSALSGAAGAIAGVNAGFFVLDPAAGAPGDPAGVGVYDGRLESETTDGRPALIVHDDASRTSVQRLSWRGSVRSGRSTLALNGLNRVPGLIRNCGRPGGAPTVQPQQDVTCTNPNEIVAFDTTYGAALPAGAGTQLTLDRRGRVVAVATTRGGAVPPGGRVLQAIGTRATALARLGHGARVQVSSTLIDGRGHPVTASARTSIVNGGPQLVRNGRIDVTAKQDGMVHLDGPSFFYGWVHKRNPRTFAGTDAHGRLMLVTADGRGTENLGLSITETAAVAKSLGMVQAMNLDGGGSTTMVVGGSVINSPSDATGERPVGDALLLLPRR